MQPDVAGRIGALSHDQVDQCGLAGTIRTDEPQDFTLPKIKTEIFQHGKPSEAFGNTNYFKDLNKFLLIVFF
jgi:hypothetical protein